MQIFGSFRPPRGKNEFIGLIKYDQVDTFCPHGGLKLGKIGIGKMVYCLTAQINVGHCQTFVTEAKSSRQFLYFFYSCKM